MNPLIWLAWLAFKNIMPKPKRTEPTATTAILTVLLWAFFIFIGYRIVTFIGAENQVVNGPSVSTPAPTQSAPTDGHYYSPTPGLWYVPADQIKAPVPHHCTQEQLDDQDYNHGICTQGLSLYPPRGSARAGMVRAEMIQKATEDSQTPYHECMANNLITDPEYCKIEFSH